jgi:hypothetical protein
MTLRYKPCKIGDDNACSDMWAYISSELVPNWNKEKLNSSQTITIPEYNVSHVYILFLIKCIKLILKDHSRRIEWNEVNRTANTGDIWGIVVATLRRFVFKTQHRGLRINHRRHFRGTCRIPQGQSVSETFAIFYKFSSVVGWGTMLQTGRSRVRVPMMRIFSNWPNPSSRTMALGSTQLLTEMSIRKIPGG